MLCIALAFVFALISVGNAIDLIQHSRGSSVPHEHVALGDIAMVDHQDGHQPDASGDQSDSLFGHHHHNGDNGNAMATCGVIEVGFPPEAQGHFGGMKQFRAGFAVIQMERPPKRILTTV